MGVGASRERLDTSESPSSSGFEPLLVGGEGLTDEFNSGSGISNVPPGENPSYASISRPISPSSPSQRMMDPFWVPPLERVSSNQHYYLISVLAGPLSKINWRASRWVALYDYILSAVFLTAVIRLIEPSVHNIPWQEVVGAVLFQAGLVTAGMAAYSVFQSCGRRCFRCEDILTVVSLCVSIYLMRSLKHPWALPSMSKDVTWQLVVGISLLEAVAIYMISRGLFLLPPKDDTILMLTTEVESLQQSIAVGLAEMYYLERLRNAGEIVKRAQGGSVAVTYRSPADHHVGGVTHNMDVPCIFIMLPLYAVQRGASYIPDSREHYIRSGRLIACEIGDKAGQKDPWLCVTGIRQGHVMDVAPSPLQIIINDVRSNETLSNESERTAQYKKEVNRFGHRLAWLLKRDGLENQVKIVEFEHDIMAHHPAACKEVLTRARHVVRDRSLALEIPSDGADETKDDAESGQYHDR